jgi:heme/copper-type cytochrome/quinol oxidase subunit 3
MAPNIEIGGVYPPFNIKVIDPYSLPLFNTALLYFSGITLSISQNYMISRLKDFTKKYMK